MIIDKILTRKMTIVVFLIDTSASMLQRTYLGTTYLDYARLAVEQFIKVLIHAIPTIVKNRLIYD